MRDLNLEQVHELKSLYNSNSTTYSIIKAADVLKLLRDVLIAV